MDPIEQRSGPALSRRIVVLGTSGSGKSTLAAALARSMNVPYIELDGIHWRANWTPTPPEQMWAIVDPVTAAPAWVFDGNYSAIRDRIWERADTLIWLDYSMTLTFSRVVWRSVRRWWQGTELWNANRERLWPHFCSRDSLFLWVLNRWRINRRDYPKRLAAQRALGKRVYRFRVPAHTDAWLRSVTQPSCSLIVGNVDGMRRLRARSRFPF